MKGIRSKKAILYSIFMILIVGIVGTYAWYSWSTNETALKLTVGTIEQVRVTLSPYRINSSIAPSADYNTNGEKSVMFSVESVNNKDSVAEVTLYYRVNSIDDALKDTGFKYTILRSEDGTNYVSYKDGNFLEATSGNDLIILEEIVPANTTYLYQVYVWIDSSDGDQSTMQGKIFDGELRANISSSANIRVDLPDGLIPVTINNSGEVTTISEDDPKWYDYDNKLWANAVLVSSGTRSNYAGTSGEPVTSSDILAYYVYVPRYRYRIWSTTTGSSPQSIEIIFENTETNKSTGTAVGQYRTHPAFTFGNTELNGIWVGKFETTQGTASNVGTDNPTILPTTTSWRSQNVSTQFINSIKFSGGTLSGSSVTFEGNPVYGLTSNTDSHMMKNSEWGAVAYISHSLYGKNNEVRLNNNSSFLTGCGASEDDEGESTDCQLEFGQETSYPQSTTGNISGVFDMSGGAHEYTMSVLADENGEPRSGDTSSSNSGFNGTLSSGTYGSGIEFPDDKYYDLYTSSDSSENWIGVSTSACNGGMCYGHALSETANWNSDWSYFLIYNNPWTRRGGRGSGEKNSGLFYVFYNTGIAVDANSWRSVLTGLDVNSSTITLGSQGDSSYASSKSVTVTVSNPNGLATGNTLKYGWSTTKGTEPTSYTEVTLSNSAGATSASFTASGSGLDGEYYLWVKSVNLVDSSGNGTSTTVVSTDTFKFDNAGPTIRFVSAGGPVLSDPNFASGISEVSVYDNSSSGNVTLSRVSMSTSYGSYALQVKSTGSAEPNFGGFQISALGAPDNDEVYIYKIVAKIPVGYSLNYHRNSAGDNPTFGWLTSNAGTGDWAEYYYYLKAGSTGTTSTCRHFSISGSTTPTESNPLTWYVAYVNVYSSNQWSNINNISFLAIDTGSKIVGYGMNQSSSTQPTYTTISPVSSVGGLYEVSDNGTYYIWAKDSLGNVTNQSVTVDKIDETPPTASVSATVSGNSVTAVLTASDSGAGVNGTYGWKISTSSTCDSSTTDFTDSTNSTYYFTISSTSDYYVCTRVSDKAGNITYAVSSKVYVDVDPPTCSISGNPSSWTKSATLTVSGSDNSDSLASSPYSWTSSTAGFGTTTTKSITANGTYTAYVKDAAGNVGSCSVTVSKIDTTNPTCSISGNPSSWTTSATLTVSGDDNSDSLASSAYSWDGSTYGTTTTKGITANGTYTAYVKDAAGNVGSCSASVSKIDRTNPTCSISGNPSDWSYSATLTVSGDDNSDSLSETPYSWTSSTTGFGTTATNTATSNTTYTAYVKDAAGNVGSCSVIVSKIDRSAPTCSISGNPSNWTTSATLTVNPSDNTSTFASSPYSWTSSTTGFSTTATKTVTSNATYKAYVKDRAGNVGSCEVTVSKIDRTVPTCSITYSPIVKTKSITLDISSKSDNTSTFASSPYSWDNSSYGATTTKTITANGTYTGYVKDYAGNVGSCSVTISNITSDTCYKINTQSGVLNCRNSASSSGSIVTTLAHYSYHWGVPSSSSSWYYMSDSGCYSSSTYLLASDHCYCDGTCEAEAEEEPDPEYNCYNYYNSCSSSSSVGSNCCKSQYVSCNVVAKYCSDHGTNEWYSGRTFSCSNGSVYSDYYYVGDSSTGCS